MQDRSFAKLLMSNYLRSSFDDGNLFLSLANRPEIDAILGSELEPTLHLPCLTPECEKRIFW